ncbi:MAG: hypothetical protein WCC60_24250 [Ilumatobacteraceae bacterium]
MRRRVLTTLLAAAVAVSLGATACSDQPRSTTPSSATAATTTDAPSTTTADEVLSESLACDPLDERACLLPWPNDAFTVPDDSTPTGRRLDIRNGPGDRNSDDNDNDSTPANADGVHIDVTDQNRADGFSPGTAVLAMVPELDVATTGIAPSTDIGASLATDAPVVLLDTTDDRRVPYWGELDAAAPPGDRLLMIHPAISLGEGHHIVVGLRHLKDASGAIIEPTSAFDAAVEGTPEPAERATAFRRILATLADAGVEEDGLYLAWDFTVASAESLSGRMLHIREMAYSELGDGAPAFTVTAQRDDGTVRTVDGTFEVPNFLTGDGAPGSTFLLGPDGLPQRNAEVPYFTAAFRCVVPVAVPTPVPGIVYGHGLLGSRDEVDALSFAARIGVAAPCATDEIGMSSDDIGNLAAILGDLSAFNQQADQMQQGLLNAQFLGRLLNNPAGFVSSPAFQSSADAPLIAHGATQFVGNSQGGVLGGAASAVSSEWSRAVLGVPGINYSLLLPRSSDWPQFQAVFDVAYPDPVDRVLALQLIQLLWDRGENDGYAQHLTTDPYAGLEAKHVLLIEAFGDHQVANVSTEVLARTVHAGVHEPALADGRSNDLDPHWGIEALDPSAPANGVLVVWDFGTPAPPPVNLPPTEPEYGADPHGAGSDEPLVLQQALTFLLTGEFDDPCHAGPCASDALAR